MKRGGKWVVEGLKFKRMCVEELEGVVKSEEIWKQEKRSDCCCGV